MDAHRFTEALNGHLHQMFGIGGGSLKARIYELDVKIEKHRASIVETLERNSKHYTMFVSDILTSDTESRTDTEHKSSDDLLQKIQYDELAQAEMVDTIMDLIKRSHLLREFMRDTERARAEAVAKATGNDGGKKEHDYQGKKWQDSECMIIQGLKDDGKHKLAKLLQNGGYDEDSEDSSDE